MSGLGLAGANDMGGEGRSTWAVLKAVLARMISIRERLSDREDEAIARGTSTNDAPRIATNATAAVAIVALLVSLSISIFCFPPPRNSGTEMGKG